MKLQETQTTESELKISEHQLFGTPPMSDSVFVFRLRSRLDSRKRSAWTGPRQALLAFSGSALMVFIIALSTPKVQPHVEMIAGSLPIEETVDELLEMDADPEELADYLGISSPVDTNAIVQETVPEKLLDESVEPVIDVTSDELIELDDSELELVLSDLDETVFF